MFTKYADMKVLASWEVAQDGSTRIAHVNVSAAEAPLPSFYATPGNTGTLHVSEALAKVAKEYDISPDPQQYIFEAVRAVTAGVPNENGDAFHRDELCRYDHRLACAVYQTFILKPHHVNHRAENPKTARGVILDAHYNDTAPALEVCPKDGCGNRTAEREGRDRTGLYCKACGTNVKDEFVEILLAIDKSKDPTFAEGVRTGVLNATSMGCVCDSTTCNVCEHVAYNKNEFCSHIRGGNKKKTFKTAAGERMAFEWCNNVVFTEQSRVDQPADPKALQQEVLQFQAKLQEEQNKPDSLRSESEILILSKRLADLNARVAQMTQAPAPQPTQPAQSAPLPDVPGSSPHKIEDYVQQKEDEKDGKPPASPAAVGIEDREDMGPGIKGATLSDRYLEELDKTAQNISAQAEGASKMATFKFKDAYKDMRLSVTKQGNYRVHNTAGTVFVIQPNPKPEGDSRKEFGLEVMRYIAANGLVAAAKKYDVAFGPRTANVLEHHLEDFEKGRTEGDKGPITDDAQTDNQEGHATPPKSAVEPMETDRASKPYDKKTIDDSVTEDNVEDFEKGREKAPTSATEEEHSVNKEKHPKKTVKDNVLDDREVDHKEAKVAQAEPPSASKPSSSKPSASKPSASKPSTSKAGAPPESAGPPSPPKAPSSLGVDNLPSDEDVESGIDNAIADQGMASGGPEGLQMWNGNKSVIMEMLAPLLQELGQKTNKVNDMAMSPAMSHEGPAQGFSALNAKLSDALDVAVREVKAGKIKRAQLEGAKANASLRDVVQILDQMLSLGQEEGMGMTAKKTAGSKPWYAKFNKSKGGSKSKSASKPSKTSTHSKAAMEKCSKHGDECTSKHAKVASTDVTAATKQYESRIGRLYKSRFAQLEAEKNKKVAEVASVVSDKFKRALKLVAARQRLNLEMSPIKAAFADTLLQPMDLGRDEYYPGMDESLAVGLIERAAEIGLDEFVEKTVERAAEIMKMSEDAFAAMEADVKNLQPVIPQVERRASVDGDGENLRTAARQGNLQIAPTNVETQEVREGRHDRTALRTALDNTKVRRTAKYTQQ